MNGLLLGNLNATPVEWRDPSYTEPEAGFDTMVRLSLIHI